MKLWYDVVLGIFPRYEHVTDTKVEEYFIMLWNLTVKSLFLSAVLVVMFGSTQAMAQTTNENMDQQPPSHSQQWTHQDDHQQSNADGTTTPDGQHHWQHDGHHHDGQHHHHHHHHHHPMNGEQHPDGENNNPDPNH